MNKVLPTLLAAAVVVAGVFAWGYYDAHQYGPQTNSQERNPAEGFQFEGAAGETATGYWNQKENYSYMVEVGRFATDKDAQTSFELKKEAVKDAAQQNDWEVKEMQISNHPAFVFRQNGNSIFYAQAKNMVVMTNASNRSEAELKKFTEWFIRHHIVGSWFRDLFD